MILERLKEFHDISLLQSLQPTETHKVCPAPSRRAPNDLGSIANCPCMLPNTTSEISIPGRMVSLGYFDSAIDSD